MAMALPMPRLAPVTIAVLVIRSSLRGTVADDAGSLHDSRRRPVVAARVVLHGPVIPERHRVGLPSPATLVLDDVGLPAQLVDQRVAVVLVDTDDVVREVPVDIDELA